MMIDLAEVNLRETSDRLPRVSLFPTYTCFSTLDLERRYWRYICVRNRRENWTAEDHDRLSSIKY